MSKKNAIIIIVVVILLIVGGIFLFSSHSTNTNEQSIATSTNPFGTEPGNKIASTSTNGFGNNGQTNTGKNLAQLLELYASPTSGSVFFTNASNQDVLQFVDRGNGNVYQYISQSQSGQPTRLTDTTIPKIQEVVWSAIGNALVYRYLDNDTDTIDSFSGAIVNAATSSGNLAQVTGSFLAQNLAQLAANPKGDKIFGLLENSDGSGSYGIESNFDGTGKKEIFESPVSYWNISWPTDTLITFTTKPTFKDYGYLFFFNTQTDSFERILGDMSGLSTLTNTDGSLVAYSQSQNNSFSLDVYDAKNKTDKNISVATLADKCVWGIQDPTTLYCAVPQTIPSDSYPDAWYEGTESFSDNIWMIDTASGATTELYQIGTNETASIDAMDLTISPDDKYLAFQNKNDLSLWLLAIQ